MTQYKQRQLRAFAILIIATMFLLGDSLFYIMFYRAMKENGGNFIAALQAHTLRIPAFLVVTTIWLTLSIISFALFSRISSYFGRNIGSLAGKIIIILEWLGFAALIAFIFI